MVYLHICLFEFAVLRLISTLMRSVIFITSYSTFSKPISGEPIPPKFLKKPDDLEIFTGESVIFVAEIESEAPLTVDWSRENEILSCDDRIKMSVEGNVYNMTFSDANIDDEGFYKCIAKNEAGRIEYEFELLVNGEFRIPFILHPTNFCKVQDKNSILLSMLPN